MLPAAVVLAGLLAVGGAFVTAGGPYDEYSIPAGTSMGPTFAEGSTIRVRTDTANDLRRGDIVLLDPRSWLVPTDAPVVKRVIGVGGDRVHGGTDGRIQVNGRAIDEDYLSWDDNAPASPVEFDTTVPHGAVFVAGDQRNNSLDSRMMVDEPGGGAFKPEDVLGTVVAVDGGPLSATTAFTDAGLSGDAYEEARLSSTRLIVLIAGAVVAVAGAVWLVLNLLRGRTTVMPTGRSDVSTAAPS